ncbi:MAG: COX15/CtaA family protein [Alphaproteobacteria bacterium]|nr:COX15/CtaA family protein [Alphaproteobacteria bacterium]
MTAAKRAPYAPDVGIWLLVICGMVAAMILLGGATRLTDSGLSITEWDFAKGVIPPLSEADWAREFALYQGTTEYQVQNRGMSMADFQFIYWWEWAHRFFGKMIGVAFALPFVVFWATGRLQGRFWAALGLFALGGLQGAIGWWMVTSGLTGRLDVAPYRLATHLAVAFAIFAFALALALDCFGWPRRPSRLGAGRVAAWALLGGLYLQIVLGAFLAGSRAGGAFTDWPTIGGEWFPSTYRAIEPLWRNLTENPAAVQFNHRTTGYVVGLLALAVGVLAAIRGLGAGRWAGLAVGVLALGQVGLGISTIVHGAPLSLSLAHQGLAVALWASAVVAVRAAWR